MKTATASITSATVKIKNDSHFGGRRYNRAIRARASSSAGNSTLAPRGTSCSVRAKGCWQNGHDAGSGVPCTYTVKPHSGHRHC